MASPHIYHHPLSPFPVIGSIKACRGHRSAYNQHWGGGGGGMGRIFQRILVLFTGIRGERELKKDCANYKCWWAGANESGRARTEATEDKQSAVKKGLCHSPWKMQKGTNTKISQSQKATWGIPLRWEHTAWEACVTVGKVLGSLAWSLWKLTWGTCVTTWQIEPGTSLTTALTLPA